MRFLEDVAVAFWEAFKAARNQRTMFLAAGLAYFAVFSLVPAALAAVSVAKLVWGPSASAAELVDGITHWVGPEPARFLKPALTAVRPTVGLSALSAIAILLAGSVVFYQLRRILNVMWDVSARSVRHALAGRLVAFLSVLLMGGLMAAVLGAHAALGAARGLMGKFVSPLLVDRLWTSLDEAALYGALTGLIALLLKLLPASSPPWSGILPGAVATAGLLTGVNHLLGAYFGRALLSGLYGAAAGFMVVLLWVYLSAEVFLFGAAFTGFYAARRGWSPKRVSKEESRVQEEAGFDGGAPAGPGRQA